ncbi:MAG: Uma2 family endonuclease [Chloroflexota bacterium]
MVAQSETRFISAAAFYELAQEPAYADALVELDEGEIVVMPKPGGRHGEITMQIGRLIGNFVAEHQLGRVTAAETGYIVEQNPDGRDTVRGLDVGFVRMERAPDGLPEGLIPFAPDLAVEVISPGNEAADINKKVLQLLRAGTRLVWIVYPETKTVMVHTPGTVALLDESGILEGGDVLPGFKLAVTDAFAV